jgi:hypothetical protein
VAVKASTIIIKYACSTRLPSGGVAEAGWRTGFPYEGEAAEVLERAGLWNRSLWGNFLRQQRQPAPGDRLRWRLQRVRRRAGVLIRAELLIVDEERRRVHRIVLIQKGGPHG